MWQLQESPQDRVYVPSNAEFNTGVDLRKKENID